MNWQEAWERLSELDGDEWDDEFERLDELWKDTYVAAFVSFALSRPGWDRENAELFAEDYKNEAIISCRTEVDNGPENAARRDVLEAEWESANAC